MRSVDFRKELNVAAKQYPCYEYDVVVIGGGMGGVAAAIESASHGARTLIVEQSGQFGGVGTNALITSFSQMPLPGKPKPTFVESILAELEAVGGADRRLGRAFSAEQLVLMLDEKVLASGAVPLFFTTMVDVTTDGRDVKRVLLHNKSGLFEVAAKVFIDSTGDGDLCWQAGASYEQGDGDSKHGQPMTLAFYMSHIDEEKMPDRDAINRAYDDAKLRGEISNPRENVLTFKAIEAGTFMFNTTRILHRDGTDGWDLSKAMIEGRMQIAEMIRFMRKLPGFENAHLQRIANRIGVRETRRFNCEYRLTYEDMKAGRQHDDVIMITDAYLDIHNPHGTGTRIELLPEGTNYDVPLRCLIPRDLDNVLIGSRCIGVSHEAFSAVRMMPHVAEYGRAAGLTAARAVEMDCAVRDADVCWVQNELATLAVRA